jgi:hypothetical protein
MTVRKWEIGQRYLMPSMEVAVLTKSHGWGMTFRYEDEDMPEAQREVPMTNGNLRYIVIAAPVQ